MTYDELKIYFRCYLSKNKTKCLKTDKGVQINDLNAHIIKQFTLIENIPEKKRVDNSLSRACKGNLMIVHDYLESL